MNENLIREIMEDALRMAVETGKDCVSVNMLKKDITATEELLIEAVDRLKKEGLVRIKNHETILTKKGREKAAKILARHEIIEKYFHDILKEPMCHNVAHTLEHFVSSETTRRMKELLNLKQKGKSAVDFPPGTNILIIAVEIPDKRIFGRLIGLGLAPGSRLKIEEEVPDAIIFNIRGRRIALAKEIAKNLVAVREDAKY
ncbi:MAG: FeoA domain-containing protein [Deltaproteobacteria bacterium]|nr:FeoA domain-containing protein [Deltaproteobacteria bacterium]